MRFGWPAKSWFWPQILAASRPDTIEKPIDTPTTQRTNRKWQIRSSETAWPGRPHGSLVESPLTHAWRRNVASETAIKTQFNEVWVACKIVVLASNRGSLTPRHHWKADWYPHNTKNQPKMTVPQQRNSMAWPVQQIHFWDTFLPPPMSKRHI